MINGSNAKVRVSILTRTLIFCQAGLNLNVFAAFKGSMFSRSKKTTETKPDGSSHSVEHRETATVADGVAHGDLKMIGQGTVDGKTREVDAKDAKALQKVDHLGIEGWKQ